MDTTTLHDKLDAKVWLCLAGGQTLPNILPVLPFKPKAVVFIHSEDRKSKDTATRCMDYLNENYEGISRLVSVDAYHAGKMQETIVRLLEQYTAENVVLNWTGGTKLMSHGARIAAGATIPCVYYDTDNGITLDEGTSWNPVPTGSMPVEDFFRLNESLEGFALKPKCRAEASEKLLLDELTTTQLLRSFVASCATYRKHQLLPYTSSLSDTDYTAPLPLPCTEVRALGDTLTTALCDDGLGHRNDKRLVLSLKGVAFLDGAWWEGFVAGRIHETLVRLGHPANVALSRNIEVTFPRHTRHAQAATKEIDIGFIHEGRLYLVSCTTSSQLKIVHDHLEEIEFVTERFGGRHARAMLALAHPLSDDKLAEIRARARKGTIVASVDEWRDPVAILEKWFA